MVRDARSPCPTTPTYVVSIQSQRQKPNAITGWIPRHRSGSLTLPPRGGRPGYAVRGVVCGRRFGKYSPRYRRAPFSNWQVRLHAFSFTTSLVTTRYARPAPEPTAAAEISDQPRRGRVPRVGGDSGPVS